MEHRYRNQDFGDDDEDDYDSARDSPSRLLSTAGSAAFKVALLGPSKAGKSSLIERLVNHNFDAKYTSTDASRPYICNLDIDGEKCQLWVEDTRPSNRADPQELFKLGTQYTYAAPGSETIVSHAGSYKDYVRADDPTAISAMSVDRYWQAAIVVYDALDDGSMDAAERVTEELYRHINYDPQVQRTLESPIPVFFVANKCDLLHAGRESQLAGRQATARRRLRIPEDQMMSVSAKKNVDVDLLFKCVVRKIRDHVLQIDGERGLRPRPLAYDHSERSVGWFRKCCYYVFCCCWCRPDRRTDRDFEPLTRGQPYDD